MKYIPSDPPSAVVCSLGRREDSRIMNEIAALWKSSGMENSGQTYLIDPTYVKKLSTVSATHFTFACVVKTDSREAVALAYFAIPVTALAEVGREVYERKAKRMFEKILLNNSYRIVESVILQSNNLTLSGINPSANTGMYDYHIDGCRQSDVLPNSVRDMIRDIGSCPNPHAYKTHEFRMDDFENNRIF